MADLTLIYDERIYSVEALQKASYRLMSVFIVDLSFDNGQIKCILKPTQEFSADGLSHHIDEFKKEVLDQHLRLKIKAETEDVRNLILGIAFSKTGFQSVE